MRIPNKAVTVIAQDKRISQIAGCFDRPLMVGAFYLCGSRSLRHTAAKLP